LSCYKSGSTKLHMAVLSSVPWSYECKIGELYFHTKLVKHAKT